jgi:hypothetical protein
VMRKRSQLLAPARRQALQRLFVLDVGCHRARTMQRRTRRCKCTRAPALEHARRAVLNSLRC